VIRDLVSLDSRGSGGVVWRIRASRTKLVCAVGSRNGTEETKLLVLDFDCDGKWYFGHNLFWLGASIFGATYLSSHWLTK